MELGRRGATVIINYLKNHEAAKTTVEELKLQGIKTTRIKAHVGEEAAIDSLVSKIENNLVSWISWLIMPLQALCAQLLNFR
ncbi:MAG: hypothetical protein CM1200mP39_20190 [Dehalococcoidia bacterium]|nr:MAG: hypothetical protein CM1200mP39_20190 [Dehalococcoidia bacterium]